MTLRLVEDAVAESSAQFAAATVAILSPREFEPRCANELSRLGWIARVTKGSGDQGADVVAELAGVRIALQFKLHAAPVGNKAVQEAFAAARHYVRLTLP